jgi:hypothetical protein
MSTPYTDTTAPSELTQHRHLEVIANEIKRDWKKPYFGAVPYLNEMGRYNTINDDDRSGDGARSCVLYFLSNAQTWRGEVAKRVKAELKSMLKG